MQVTLSIDKGTNNGKKRSKKKEAEHKKLNRKEFRQRISSATIVRPPLPEHQIAP